MYIEQLKFIVYTYTSVEDISHFCTNIVKLTLSNTNFLSNCKHHFRMIYRKTKTDSRLSVLDLMAVQVSVEDGQFPY